MDWEYVKKTTLWHYEQLISKLQEALVYKFVDEYHNHSMSSVAEFALQMQEGYVQHGRQAGFITEIAGYFNELERLGVRDVLNLVERVDTRDSCEAFLEETGFEFEALIQTLNFLLRWALPFRCPLKELIHPDSGAELVALKTLKAHKITSNLDVLDTCRTAAGRRQLSAETGIDEALLLNLAHRADMTRLAYVRGKTVLHLCGGGYDSIEKLAAADMEKIEADMSAYYQTLGKSLSDFKAVIPLDWMVGGAGVIPRVVEE